ncbi:MAG: hypothetical protein RL161_545 [Bacteroidota bacterium]|jgi:polyhydroxybutyrate depolymerase
MRILIHYFLLIVFLSSCQSENEPLPEQPAEQKNLSLTVDGIERSYLLYLPEGYTNTGLLPLIYVLHGGTGTPEGMLRLADFRPIADREKVILVYPAGFQKNWNDGRPTTPNQLGINDVKFFSQLTDLLTRSYSIDASKIYATGISNGGFMASRLGCQLSSKLAAIAVVAASMEANTIAPACSPGVSVPALYIHGTVDPLVPFAGGEMIASGTAGGFILSHTEVIEKWVNLNGCSPNPKITDLEDKAIDGTTIRRRVYSNASNGSEVVSFIVQNGGHTWPQGYQYLSELIIGKTSQDMNACEVIWDFFKKFDRK